MVTISLFSGCGGLDYGFESAGFGIILRNDFDKYSCDTLRLNSKVPVLEKPIENVTIDEIKKITGSSSNAVDLVIGGPPCQPFSKSAYWSNGDTLRLNDERANTLAEYFRIIQSIKPKAFLIENVHGINYSGKEDGFKYIINSIKEINISQGTNYVPSWKILNAAKYGVPQLRERFFLVAFKDGRVFQFPQVKYGDINESNLFGNNIISYVNAWDAIGNIKNDLNEKLDIGGYWSDLLPSIPEGENYLWHTNRKGGLPLFGWRTRYWCFLLKLAKNKPSWTIQAQPGSSIGPFHWENRKLSWKEMAAIQTFPSDFLISGPRVEIQRQLGNAVPSLLAELLAREIAIQGFEKKYEYEPKLKINKSENIPEPEMVLSVPSKYYCLIGEHLPHPGTGKGNLYKRSKIEDNVTLNY
jgi:DNA (cytosine-5)-methyltransferase 1